MKDNNLSKSNVLELANLFLAQVVSIEEFEKISGISATVILKIFNIELYYIDATKAESVKKILNSPKYMSCTGYIKEFGKN